MATDSVQSIYQQGVKGWISENEGGCVCVNERVGEEKERECGRGILCQGKLIPPCVTREPSGAKKNLISSPLPLPSTLRTSTTEGLREKRMTIARMPTPTG